MSFLNHPAHRASELVRDGYTVIDVREPHEVSTGALPDSVNIPLAHLPERISSYPLSSKIAVVCQSGGRSLQASQMLISMGYRNIANLHGGMNAASLRSFAH